MSKSDTCTACGKTGHTASSCKSPMKSTPIAPHTVEPYDGHERMVRCIDCTRQGIYNDYFGRRSPTGCASYVPSMADTLQHCPWHRLLPKHARAAA